MATMTVVDRILERLRSWSVHPVFGIVRDPAREERLGRLPGRR